MIWKGHISFGLVNIPVALYPAEARKELDFTLLDEKDLSPIGYRKVNKAIGEEVPRERITRGFEYEEGHHVIVSDDDLRRANPERTQRIDILYFTDADGIDAKYYDRPYYLEPAAKNEKGYALLREALRRTSKVAIASVVVRTRQCVAALISEESALVLNLLRFPSELRDPARLALPGKNLKALGISGKQVQVAERLVEEMAEPWNPEKHRDEYREELMAFIRKRIKSGKIEEVAEPEAPRKKKAAVIDIMTLLKRSVEKAEKTRPRPRARKSA